MSDSEAILYVYTVYFHTHHHLPKCLDLITGVLYFFYWGTDDVFKFGWRSGFVSFSFHSKPTSV